MAGSKSLPFLGQGTPQLDSPGSYAGFRCWVADWGAAAFEGLFEKAAAQEPRSIYQGPSTYFHRISAVRLVADDVLVVRPGQWIMQPFDGNLYNAPLALQPCRLSGFGSGTRG